MADDLRISAAFPRHPKTVKLRRRLEERGPYSLICLWAFVADNRPDGNLNGLTVEDIEIAAEWTGEPGAFVTAAVGVGWLDGSDGSYSLHDWLDHQPWVANRPARVEAARAAARKRWSKEVACEPDATRMQPACDGNASACDPHESAMPPRTTLHTRTTPTTRETSPSELSSDARKGKVVLPIKEPHKRSHEAEKLSQLLKSEILKNSPSFRITPTQERNWAKAADRMLRLDRRTPQQVEQLIQWVQADQFWAPNCLSMDKLRMKFDELWLKRDADCKPRKSRLDRGFEEFDQQMAERRRDAAANA
jgi:hypothetical protein